MIEIGIETLVEKRPPELEGKRLALLCNQASTDRHFTHSRDLILQAYPGQLVCLFTPQHGFYSEKQDNMIESAHGRDRVSGLSVYSLYGETRKPYPAMFADIDILLVDLIDVGTRVYTFIWTVVLCLQTAAETGKKVVILDRPNPLGGDRVEGNILEVAWASFVGMYPIPMRHGLTIGELAMLCNREMAIGADLQVLPVQGLQRSMPFSETGFPWVFPSPNMPTVSTAFVYPGQVIWEGTNLSEGRGTTLPFELIGAPFVEPDGVARQLRQTPLPGCVLRPLVFEPTSGKWRGESCPGFQLHVIEEKIFCPYRTSLALLQACLLLYPDDFHYKKPPYEYEFERLPMDLILGSRDVRCALEDGVDILEIERSWQPDLQAFNELRQTVFLYE